MEGATTPLAVAIRAADDLGQHSAGVRAFGDDVPVVPVGGEHVVVAAQRGTGPGAGCLLADVHVEVPADEALVVRREVEHLLLHAAHAEHDP